MTSTPSIILGYLYANGIGGRRDEELAAAWLHLVAAQNAPQSKRILTMLGFAKRPKRQPVCALTDGRDALRPERHRPWGNG